jgi:hypothetical protein
MSGKTEVIVTAEPQFLDFETTCQVLGKIGKDELRQLMQAGLIKCQNIGKRIVFRWAEVQRFAEFCYACSGEISSCTIGNTAGAPVLAVVLRTGRSLRESGVGAELSMDWPGRLPDQPPRKSCRPGCERQVGAARTDAVPFGGVCDRCGQPYLQRSYPYRSLCPSCSLGGSESTERGRLLGRTQLTGVRLAAS